MNITPTFEFHTLCIACLSEDISGVRSNPELAKVYEELIQEQVCIYFNFYTYYFTTLFFCLFICADNREIKRKFVHLLWCM